MTKKLVIIGIDSMDIDLINKYIESLPNFKRFLQKSPKFHLRSVFPPDSDTAWASIYTGMNPAKHGIVNFVDPLIKSLEIQTEETESKNIRGKTFWDILGRYNKKICLLLPHATYPGWKVNGIIVSKSRKDGSITYISEEQYNIDFNRLNSPVGVPKKDDITLMNFVKTYRELIFSESTLFETFLKENKYDLYFCYFSELDTIQHYFWNYQEMGDTNVDNKKQEKFANVIKEFYIDFDKIVGRLESLLDKNTVLIIMSDHGHGSRPKTVVNINEILRINGLVIENERKISNNLLINIYPKLFKVFCEYDLGWIFSKIIRISPRIKKYCNRPEMFNYKKSIAYVSDLSGIKAYTYGGIIINSNLIDKENYDQIRDRVIEIIKNDLGNKIEWIAKREDLYLGEYIKKFPDILIQMKDGYGLGMEINTPILTQALSTNIVPGSHKGDTPVFILINSDIIPVRENINMEDITPTIYDLFNIEPKELVIDGKSIFS